MIEYVPTHSALGKNVPCLRAMKTRDCTHQHRWIPVELIPDKALRKLEAVK